MYTINIQFFHPGYFKGLLEFSEAAADLGVAVENGMDCIIKSVKMLNELQPDLDTVCLDFKNAFNNIGRFQIRRSLVKYFPRLVACLIRSI